MPEQNEDRIGGEENSTFSLPNSPVQEQHIDFLLEEEFACNGRFLEFFLSAAREHFHSLKDPIETPKWLQPCHDWNCKAIRSVTTDKGETDVLAIYQSAETPGRVAILIEDKIRAGFQPNQAERYRTRGETGTIAREWDHFWTCLIAPEKYAQDNRGFDTRISLEKLVAFFDGSDERSRFKAGVLKAALHHFNVTGVQQKDEAVTQFRSFYSAEAEKFFVKDEVNWPRPRVAWWGDTWFNFTGGGLPAGSEIVYKAPSGFVDLAFRNTKEDVLAHALAGCLQDPGIIPMQTGKSASFRLRVEPLTNFADHTGARSVVMKSFQCVRDLLAFYKANSGQIREGLSTRFIVPSSATEVSGT